jgi:hypothetical protein
MMGLLTSMMDRQTRARQLSQHVLQAAQSVGPMDGIDKQAPALVALVNLYCQTSSLCFGKE